MSMEVTWSADLLVISKKRIYPENRGCGWGVQSILASHIKMTCTRSLLQLVGFC